MMSELEYTHMTEMAYEDEVLRDMLEKVELYYKLTRPGRPVEHVDPNTFQITLTYE